MSERFEMRLAALIASGEPFSADDLTMSGQVTADEFHTPNGKRSSIGSLFSAKRKAGLIEPTGAVVNSTAPHRKGGLIRVWRGTPKGVRWAIEVHGRRPS